MAAAPVAARAAAGRATASRAASARAAEGPPVPTAPPAPPRTPRAAPAAPAPPAASRGRRRGPLGAATNTGGGFVLAILFWSWIALPFFTDGATGVRNTLRAKFFNKDGTGNWLP